MYSIMKGTDVLTSLVSYSILVGKIDTAQPRWQGKDCSERLKEIHRWVLYIFLTSSRLIKIYLQKIYLGRYLQLSI